MRWWWLGVLLMLSGSVYGQPVVATVTGRVTEAGSGQPIGNFRIGVGQFAGIVGMNTLGTASTNPNGVYTITIVASATTPLNVWTEDARYPGYAWPDGRFHYDGPEGQAGNFALNQGSGIPLGTGGLISGIDFTVTKPAVLTGRVISQGIPVSDAVVEVRTEFPPRAAIARVFTDAEGRFSLRRMHPGTGPLAVSKQGFLNTRYPNARLDGLGQLAAGQSPANLTLQPEQALDIELPLDRGYQLQVSGTSLGVPVPISAQVRGTDPALGGMFASGLTLAYGLDYFIHAPQSASYRGVAYPDIPCAVWPCAGAQPFRLAAGDTPPDIVLPLTARQVLHGTVRNTFGLPLAGVRVSRASRSLFPFSGLVVRLDSVSAVTDALGRYQLPGLEPGQHLVAAVSPSPLVWATTLYPSVPCLPLAACNTAGGTPLQMDPDQDRFGADLTFTALGARILGRATLARPLQSGEQVSVTFQEGFHRYSAVHPSGQTIELAGAVVPIGTVSDATLELIRPGLGRISIRSNGAIDRGELAAAFSPQPLPDGVRTIDFGNLDPDEFLLASGF